VRKPKRLAYVAATRAMGLLIPRLRPAQDQQSKPRAGGLARPISACGPIGLDLPAARIAAFWRNGGAQETALQAFRPTDWESAPLPIPDAPVASGWGRSS